MKSLLLTSILILLTACSFAQDNTCHNTYVWDFCTEDGRKEVTITKNFTEDFEAEFTRQGCVVLQRRKFSNLMAQEENEKAIHTLKGSNPKIEQSLKDIKAESVVFGQISFNSYYDKYSIYVSIEQLETKQILESYKFSILKKEADSDELRKKAVRSAIDSLLQSNVGAEKTENTGRNQSNSIAKNSVILSSEDSYKQQIEYGRLKLQSENYEDAIAHFENSLKFKPNDSLAIVTMRVCKDSIFSALTRQGDEYALFQDYETAIQNYKKATTFKPDKIIQNKIESCMERWYGLLVWRADQRYLAMDWNSAIEEFREAQVIKPNDKYCLKQIENCTNRLYQEAKARAKSLYDEREWEQSLESYFSVHESFPDSLEILGIFETFLKRKLILVPETNLQIVYKLGNAYSNQRNFKGARKIYKDGLKYKPEDRQCTNKIKSCNEQLLQKLYSNPSKIKLKAVFLNGVVYIETIEEDDSELFTQIAIKLVNNATEQSCWSEINSSRKEGCIIQDCAAGCELSLYIVNSMGGVMCQFEPFEAPSRSAKPETIKLNSKKT